MACFHRLFTGGRPAVIGMVHCRALPGTPLNSLTLTDIVNKACEEAAMLRDQKLDGILVENMFDIPYVLSPGPEITSSMTTICTRIRELCPHLPLGVQILAAANREALAVAQAAQFDFIRVEGFLFAHVADEGLIQSCAGDLLRYRRKIQAENIAVLTDIKKKHCSHSITADVSLSETAEAAEFFLSDGLIVTGSSTGHAPLTGDVRQVKSATKLPLLIGSGVNADNVEQFLLADGLIIGSYFKKENKWRNDLDESKIGQFMKKIRKLRDLKMT